MFNNDLKTAEQCILLNEDLKNNFNDEDGDLIKAVLLNFYGLNLNGL